MGGPHHHSATLPGPLDTSKFHLLEALPRPSILDQRELIETILMEALCRGANELELMGLELRLERERGSHLPEAEPVRRPGLMNGALRLTVDPELAALASRTRLTSCIAKYRALVQQEFDGLPQHVRAAFLFDYKEKTAPKNKHSATKADPAAETAEKRGAELSYYSKMRAVYYQNGYSWPAHDIFSKIGPAKFLKKHDVSGGLHEGFRERLPPLERLLAQWSPGLVEKISMQIHSVGGFVPRFIAPRQGQKRHAPALSNHAFGLAIDIDSPWNPHIKDREVIEVLKEITGYDFGEYFVAKGKTIAPLDWAAQIHMRERESSEQLKTWLRRYLPIYRSFLPAGQATLPAAKPGPAAQNAPASIVEPTQCVALDATTAVEMERVQVLRKFHTMAELEAWSDRGIQTIPVELAAAMAQLGFRWGAMYEHTKDVMHFELLAAEVIKPDAAYRPLEEILNDPHRHVRAVSHGWKERYSKPKV